MNNEFDCILSLESEIEGEDEDGSGSEACVWLFEDDELARL